MKPRNFFRVLILTALLYVCPARAQVTNTNPPVITGPIADFISFATTAGATNWMIAPYGIYDAGSKTGGGGIALAYKLSDFVVPTMRLDYVNREIWMPSGTLQLQAPVTFFGKVTVIPFVFGGIATPIAGKGADNGSAVGMFGTGGAIRLSSRLDLVGDVEKWSGGGFTGLQYRGGIAIKF